MLIAHLFNLAVHVIAGALAILLGLVVVRTQRDQPKHRSRGRLYVALTLLVCLTAAIGNAVFRFLPLFAVLTLLVSYQLFSGWHVIHTRAAGPNALDALLLAGGAGGAAMLGSHVLAADPAAQTSAPVLMSTLGAVAILLVYDALRWIFPGRWHAFLWRYEHIYKLVGSLFAMVSAAVGNTIRAGQPWSQLIPSVVGLAVIIWCWVDTFRLQQKLHAQAASTGCIASFTAPTSRGNA